MAVHKPSENVLYQGRIQNLFQGRAPDFVTFSSVVFFPAELILSNLSNKNNSRGDRGHAPPKIFQKFAYCNGHFSAFCTIFRQRLFIFLAPTFECFTKYNAFCRLRTVSVMRA